VPLPKTADIRHGRRRPSAAIIGRESELEQLDALLNTPHTR